MFQALNPCLELLSFTVVRQISKKSYITHIYEIHVFINILLNFGAVWELMVPPPVGGCFLFSMVEINIYFSSDGSSSSDIKKGLLSEKREFGDSRVLQRDLQPQASCQTEKFPGFTSGAMYI